MTLGNPLNRSPFYLVGSPHKLKQSPRTLRPANTTLPTFPEEKTTADAPSCIVPREIEMRNPPKTPGSSKKKKDRSTTYPASAKNVIDNFLNDPKGFMKHDLNVTQLKAITDEYPD